MELKGLKALFLGDSITEGAGVDSIEESYWRVLGKCTGMEVKGYGLGGTRIARQMQKSEWAQSDLDFNRRAVDMDKDADIVCVFGGTNDYGHGFAPIGRIGDDTEYTFYGALECLFGYLIKTYPKAFIFVMTPLHRLNEDRLTGDGFKPPMLPLSGYVDIIREVANKYSLPVLDLFANSGIYPAIDEHRALYMPDGLHPSAAACRRIASLMENFLRAFCYEKP